MIIRWIIDLLNIGVEVGFAYWLFDVPEKRRFKTKWVHGLEYSMFSCIAIMTFCNRLIGIRFSNVLNVAQICLFIICLCVFVKSLVIKKIAFPAIYFMCISVGEIPGIVITSEMLKQPFIECISSNLIYDYIYLLIFTLVLIGIWLKTGKYIRKAVEELSSISSCIVLLLLGCAIWICMFYFLSLGFSPPNSQQIVYYFLFLLCIILAFLVSVLHYRNNEKDLNNRLLRLYEAKSKEQIEQLINKNQERTKELHDMKQRWTIVNDAIATGKYEIAGKNLEDIRYAISMAQMKNYIYTGYSSLDILINNKKRLAENDNIKFEVAISDIKIPMPESELCILLGNLLDNAIEAARQVVDEERFVKVFIYSKNKMFFIVSENNCCIAPVKVNERYITSKRDVDEHGFGLLSIKEISERYGGEVNIESDQNRFRITISIFIK